jgi:sucrose-6F-phosphate phosphohydrolase
MLVSDIDGTLLEGGRSTAGLEQLRQVVEERRDDVALVYATGRSFDSTWQLVESGVLPTPDAIAPFLGTEIWFPGWAKADPFYREIVRHDWNRDAVEYFARRIAGLELQEQEFQSPLKVSFYVNDRKTIFDLKQIIDDCGLSTRAIYSGGRFLDIIPRQAGKRAAVRYLGRVWRVEPDHVLTCGDSGNDLDMLCDPDTLNVAVGNAEVELRGLAHTGAFYSAILPFAAGLLEGAAALGFWSLPRTS